MKLLISAIALSICLQTSIADERKMSTSFIDYVTEQLFLEEKIDSLDDGLSPDQLSSIEIIDLSGEYPHFNSQDFVYLTNLKHLNLQKNNLEDSDELIKTIKGLKHLKTLKLDGNKFSNDFKKKILKTAHANGVKEIFIDGKRYVHNATAKAGDPRRGILGYESKDGTFRVKVIGKASARTNFHEGFGEHRNSSDNSNYRTDTTNGSTELGDDNPGKGQVELGLRLEKDFNLDLGEDITLERSTAYVLYRSMPTHFVDEVDENIFATRGRQTGPKFEGAASLKMKVHEVDLIVKAGRFKVFGNDALVDVSDELSVNGRPFALDEHAQWGDAVQFKFFRGGTEKDPKISVELSVFDSAMRLGEDAPVKTFSGDIGVAGNFRVKLNEIFSPEIARSIEKIFGEVQLGVGGVYSRNGDGIQQNSVVGMVGFVRNLGSGRLLFRASVAYTDRTRLDSNGMNDSYSTSTEVGYEIPLKKMLLTVFANHSFIENLGGHRDQIFKHDGTRRGNILQLGIKSNPRTGTFWDNFEFAFNIGTILNTSTDGGGDKHTVEGFGGDPNGARLDQAEFFASIQIAYYFNGTPVDEEEKKVIPYYLED